MVEPQPPFGVIHSISTHTHTHLHYSPSPPPPPSHFTILFSFLFFPPKSWILLDAGLISVYITFILVYVEEIVFSCEQCANQTHQYCFDVCWWWWRRQRWKRCSGQAASLSTRFLFFSSFSFNFSFFNITFSFSISLHPLLLPPLACQYRILEAHHHQFIYHSVISVHVCVRVRELCSVESICQLSLQKFQY